MGRRNFFAEKHLANVGQLNSRHGSKNRNSRRTAKQGLHA
jgi:hypothetical protein